MLGFELLGSREIYYGIPFVAAGVLPWMMTEELCESYERSTYSWLALKTQVWLHLGGAIPSAVRTLRNTRTAVADW